MNESVDIRWHMIHEQNKDIEAAVSKDRGRLLNFIRKSIPDEDEAEDILQDALYLFVEQYRMPDSIEQVSAWLFRVIRNKIIDRFRKKKAVPISRLARTSSDDSDSEQSWLINELFPETDDGPETEYVKKMAMDAIFEAIEELPAEQKEVFVQHEIEGLSFKEISAKNGVQINTLLSRKRYAVMFLRTKLRDMYEEFIYE